MIGNDVVDLALAQKESNWRRKNYLDKVFTKLEQEFILSAKNPDEMVWHLWSRKEAVYKIIRQNGGKLGYYPKAIACLDTSTTAGEVHYQQTFFYTKTHINNFEIHSIAVTTETDFKYVHEIDSSSNIEKEAEIPNLVLNKKRYAVSKSHHGKYEKTVCLIKF